MNPYVPTVEIGPCDIGAYRVGNGMIDYVTTFDSGKPGPHVMINALTHGNEVCGAHALCFLFENNIRPLRGRLTLSFANVAAYQRFDPAAPFDSRFVDEDFNRLWDEAVLDGGTISVELARAREMRPLLDTVDLLLDIHSTSLPNAPMLLAGTTDQGLDLARAVGYPVQVVIDAGHASGRRMRDYRRFGDPRSPQASLLVECGQHFEKAAVAVAIETALRFLRHCDIAGPSIMGMIPGDSPPAQIVTRITEAITIRSENFVFERDFEGFDIIARADTLFARDGELEYRTPYDDCVMVMPAHDILPGLTAVRLGRIIE